MSDFSLLSDRIQYLLDTYHLSQSELGRQAGVKPSSVACWLNGVTKTIRAPVAKRLCNSLSISFDWLIDGTGSPAVGEPERIEDNDPLVEIPEFVDISFSCGPGCPVAEYGEASTISPRVFRQSWFIRHGVKPHDCKIVHIQGDSMEPCLYDGDTVVINTADCTRILSGKVYAFVLNNELRIKRLYTNLKGDITVKSDNKEYSDEVFDHDCETESIKLIGRVIAKFGYGGL